MVSQSNLILVVDDDREVAGTHAELLKEIGYSTLTQSVPEQVEPVISKNPKIDLVLLDIHMPGLGGLELLQRIKLRWPQVGVVMATVINDIESAVRAIKSGAYNYLLKPLQSERLEVVLRSYFENQPRRLVADPRFSTYITGCAQFEEIFRRVSSFAEADVPVLIQGETGTGKELIAQLIHSLSKRNDKRFFGVNVAALPTQLFESELFGHCKGAFTGAHHDKPGYFQEAAEGTLFLDEIGELDSEQQKKLLRVLQTRRYCRVGETAERELKARLVIATNRNLRDDTRVQRFREDLFFRLSSYCVVLPALRDRTGDVELLSNYFLKKYASQFGRSIEGFHPQTLNILRRYPFPGNVRELEGIVSGAVLIEQSAVIMPTTLPPHLREVEQGPEAEDLATVQYRAIMRALASCNGNQTKAAEKLGIARQTLNRLLKEYRERESNP